MDDFEEKLTVRNGYPINTHRGDPDAAIPDYDAVQANWIAWGLDAANEYDLGEAFLALFVLYNGFQGEHPQVAAEDALKKLGLFTFVDIFMGVFDPGSTTPTDPQIPPVLTYFMQREDGSYILREDAFKIIRE